MNMSRPFIDRPVMTTLIMAAILIFGVMAFRLLPVNDLPNVDFPTIQVSAGLPGASPETMAAAVATPLERQFSTIDGLDSMVSTNTLGSTLVTLQFSLRRNLDAAAQDIQSAISRAQRLLHPFPHQHKGGHGFGRAAALGNHHHQRLPRVHGRQGRVREIRVHVIQDHQPRTVLRECALYRVRAAQAAIQRPRAQRAAANPHHAHGIERASQRGRELADGADRRRLKRKVGKPVHPVVTQLAERFQGLQRLRRGSFDFGPGDAVAASYHVRQQVSLVKLNGHCASDCRPRRRCGAIGKKGSDPFF